MAAQKSGPKDVQVMNAILKDMGIRDYEPRVINQMLEFVYRYVTDVLEDAKLYSNHANKKTIDVDDIKLAIQCQLDHVCTTPPPRDLLADLGKHKNSIPLPQIKPYTGPKLPPDRYCLAASNFKLKNQRTRPRLAIPYGVQPGALQSPGGLRLTPRSGITLVQNRPSTPGMFWPNTPQSPYIRLNQGASPSTPLRPGMDLKRKREDDVIN